MLGIVILQQMEDLTDEQAIPEGQKPLRIKTGTGGGKIVHFDKKTCDLCPRQSDCPVKRVKQSAIESDSG